MEGSTSELRYSVVIAQLGPALFGNELIAGLTAREMWLIEWEGSLPATGMTYADDGVRIMGDGTDPEYRKALKKYDFMRWQRERIKMWLDSRKVEILDRGYAVNAQHFEAAFAKAFLQLAANRRTIAHEQSAGQGTASRRRAVSATALERAFAKLTAECRRSGAIVTEDAARQAMRDELGEGVPRQAIRDLLRELPAKYRAPPHRPSRARGSRGI